MKPTSKRLARAALGGLLLAACGLLRAAPAATVEQVQECMRANVPVTLQIKQFMLTSTDKNGERNMKGRLYALREDGLLRTMLRLEEPADMRGAAYLLREPKNPQSQDEMYVFLPALNKVRRIVGGSQDSALFGTDISYADIKQINHAFAAGEVRLEKTEPYEGRPAYVLALQPAPEQQSRYRLIRSWVDQQSCVALRADFIDETGVRKRFTAPAAQLQKSGEHWYVAEGVMEDLTARTRTRLRVTGVSSGTELADRLFNPRSFYLGG